MYSAHQLSDGFVPDKVVKRFQEEASDPKALEKCLAIVVPGKGPLLEKVNGGVQMHDYGDFNPTAAHVKKLASVRAEAGRLGNLRRYGKCEQQLPLADASSVCDGKQQASVPSPSSSSKDGSSSKEFRVDVTSAVSNGPKPSQSQAKPIYPEGKGSGEGEPSAAPAVPSAPVVETPLQVLLRVYGQEFEQRCQRKPTIPDSVAARVGEWFAKVSLKEDELRYCIGCLLDDDKGLAFLPNMADEYLSRRSHDDFASSKVLLITDRDPVEDLEPGVSRLPPGYEWSPDLTMRRCKPGTPLPPGWTWGVDEMPHPPVEVVPWKPPVAAQQAPKEKHLVTRDPEKIAKAKAQLAEMTKRDAEAKAASAPATEAKP
jgi:hypothetical protein